MKIHLKKVTPLRFFDAVFSVWCVVWFLLPVAAGFMEIGSSSVPNVPPFYLPLYFMKVNGTSIVGVSLFLVYALPLWALLKLFYVVSVSFNLKAAAYVRGVVSPSCGVSTVSRIVLSAIGMYAGVVPMVFWAISPLWFSFFPVSGWITLGCGVVLHLVSLTCFLKRMNARNPAFAEYKEFIHNTTEDRKKAKRQARQKRREAKRTAAQDAKNAKIAAKAEKAEKKAAAKLLAKQKKDGGGASQESGGDVGTSAAGKDVRREKTVASPRGRKARSASGAKNRNGASASSFEVLLRIRSKLFIAFIGIILMIILSLSFLILARYRTTIMQIVSDMAHNQVMQASTTYRVNLGDQIAMSEYLTRQKEINARAEFYYNDLSIYTDLQSNIHLDDIPESLPAFRVEYTTRQPGKSFPLYAPLDGAVALQYVKDFIGHEGRIPPVYDTENRLVSFVMPVVVQGNRVIGFSVLEFNQDVITKSYFQTKISVFVITAIFIYIAVILTYCIGNYIVNPLLFLRMNVRKISDVLSSMISGDRRISSSALVYQDYVKSHDEIKALSGEINDMVTVIRGIVPYISASTLRQAEKGTATTSRRGLTFLFTDIRGFTTLCEGMSPEEVVSILNHYLNLETEIILSNHGDVDKFVGDEVMGFFEGPNKEINACRAALQLCTAMAREREERSAKGLPVVSIGIGINTGNVVFGSVGAHDRMDFTSIGDTVNLAARLEGANKVYMSKAIITEAVYAKLENRFVCRELDFIAVKGKNEPVRIYELLEEEKNADPKTLKLKAAFERGLSAYRKGNWGRAEEIFKKCVETYDDGPSEMFLERVALFAKNPPPKGWDGVFRMTVK